MNEILHSCTYYTVFTCTLGTVCVVRARTDCVISRFYASIGLLLASSDKATVAIYVAYVNASSQKRDYCHTKHSKAKQLQAIINPKSSQSKS